MKRGLALLRLANFAVANGEVLCCVTDAGAFTALDQIVPVFRTLEEAVAAR